MQDPAEQQAAPMTEVIAGFANGKRYETTLAPQEIPPFSPNVTHANFSCNKLYKCNGLDVFPNLLRLTVRQNELYSLTGLRACPNLRWVDASRNNMMGFGECERTDTLEWLDVHSNDLRYGVDGIDFAPRLTFLNLHNNRLKSLEAIHVLTQLRYIDASDNDLEHVRGLEKCRALVEINVSANRISDAASVTALTALPHLVRLNIFANELNAKEGVILAAFKRVAPRVEVITTEAAAVAAGMQGRHKRPVGAGTKRAWWRS
jgi:Leucine-rich repeat (LRR) protein